MTIKRLIPMIQLDGDYQAVKTVQFRDRIYIGDPLNLIKLYNDLGADEVALFNIDNRTNKSPTSLTVLRDLAAEARMPLTYGGGLNSIDEVQEIISYGFEKISFSMSTFTRSELPFLVVKRFGLSAVQAVLNVKKNLFGKYNAYCHLTKKNIGPMLKGIEQLISYGCGEILIQSVNKDGTRSGLDLNLINQLDLSLRTPLIMSGGLSTHQEAITVLDKHNLSGIASGSAFTFSSSRNGVLPSYPSDDFRGI